MKPSFLLVLGSTRKEDLSADLLGPLFRGTVKGNADSLQREVLAGASIFEDLLDLFLGEAMVRDRMRSSVVFLCLLSTSVSFLLVFVHRIGHAYSHVNYREVKRNRRTSATLPCGKKSKISRTPPGRSRSTSLCAARAGSSKWWKPNPTTAMSKWWKSKPENSLGSGSFGSRRLPW